MLASAIVTLVVAAMCERSHAQDNNFKTVVVTGSGATSEKALQNALSMSVQQVVGTLVDSETIVTNQDYIQEKIISASNGYVESYDVVKTWQADQICNCRIKAKVKSRAIQQQLEAINTIVLPMDGKALEARVTTEKQAAADAAEMLYKQLSTFAERLITVQATNAIKPIGEKDGTTTIVIPIVVRVDQEAYKNRSRALCEALDKLSLKHMAFSQMFAPARPIVSLCGLFCQKPDVAGNKTTLTATRCFGVYGPEFGKVDAFQRKVWQASAAAVPVASVIKVIQCDLQGKLREDDYFVDKDVAEKLVRLSYSRLTLKVTLLDDDGTTIDSYDDDYMYTNLSVNASRFVLSANRAGSGSNGAYSVFVFPGGCRFGSGFVSEFATSWAGNAFCEVQTSALPKVKSAKVEVYLKKVDGSEE
jgi:hypothetical protein